LESIVVKMVLKTLQEVEGAVKKLSSDGISTCAVVSQLRRVHISKYQTCVLNIVKSIEKRRAANAIGLKTLPKSCPLKVRNAEIIQCVDEMNKSS